LVANLLPARGAIVAHSFLPCVESLQARDHSLPSL
jgi:hypothetical protein